MILLQQSLQKVPCKQGKKMFMSVNPVQMMQEKRFRLGSSSSDSVSEEARTESLFFKRNWKSEKDLNTFFK